MKTNKLERLQAAGWKVGNTEDFLQLSDEEAQLVALKLSMINAVKNHVLKESYLNRPCTTDEIKPVTHC